MWGSTKVLGLLTTDPIWIRIQNIDNTVVCLTPCVSCLQEIKKFAEKQMGTPDVRIDTRLNKAIWAQGVRGTAFRLVEQPYT